MNLNNTQLRLVQIMVDRGCKIDMTPERIVSGMPAKLSHEIRTAAEKQAWMVDQGLAQVIKALDHDSKSIADFVDTLSGVSTSFARSALKGHTFGRHGWCSDDASDATVRRAVKELIGILDALPPEESDEAS